MSGYAHAYVHPCTYVAPSRCALMTGKHSGHCTVRDNGGYLNANDTTVAEVLKKAGYTTALFGKWGLSLDDASDPRFPTNVSRFDLKNVHYVREERVVECMWGFEGVGWGGVVSRNGSTLILHVYMCSCVLLSRCSSPSFVHMYCD